MKEVNIKFNYKFSKLLVLILLLAFAFFMAYIPHLGYPYPVHHDEWMHMTYCEAIVDAGSTSFIEPFHGQWTMKGLIANPETGFYIMCAAIQQVTGISWPDLFTYFPALIFMVTVLAVYNVAERWGFGLEAAFFTCLLPTFTGILGPAFMVPLSIGILMVPLMLFLGCYHQNWQGCLLVLIITSFMIVMHAPTAIIILILLIVYIMLNLRRNIKGSIGMLLAIAVPFLLVTALFHDALLKEFQYLIGSSGPSKFVRFPDLILSFGILPLIFSFLGIIYLFSRGDRKHLGLVFGLLALLLMLLVFYRFGYGLSVIYERGLMYLLLLLSIIAGAGLFWLRQIIAGANYRGNYVLSNKAGEAISIIMVLLTLGITIPNRLNEEYYHMIDKTDYESFTWIKENLGSNLKVALVDPWKATAFTALTRKYTIHRIFTQREPVDNQIEAILSSGCANSDILRDSEIDFIYNRAGCNNPDLAKIKNNIFLFNNTVYNILQNAGFERPTSDRPYPWIAWSQNTQPVFVFPAGGLNSSNSVGIRMSEKGPYEPWPQSIWQQDVPVEAGTSYLLGGWIKTENISGAGGASIIVTWMDVREEWITSSDIMEYIKGTNGWSYYEGVVIAPQGAAKCGICCYLAGCSGTAWFDNIIFKRVDK